jgi:two-component system, cell cycle sensor histidine kinase and response regulator CckA
MRVKLPLQRRRFVPADQAPILRYAIAILSVDLILALVPTFFLSDVVIESRLVIFSVAIMVSAWYGGWKPGLVATTFASIFSAYFSLAGVHSSSEHRKALIHLVLFVFVALLICSFNAALRSAEEGLRRSEINFRSLVTNAPYGICRCDSAGNFLDVNPALISVLGYESAAEILGRNLAGFYPDSQQWFTVADNFRLMRPFNGLLAEWSRKDGTLVGVRLSGRSIRGDREALFYELYAEDITEQRALEQQIRQYQKMEAVGRLAGGIAHDFNNLLTVISGYSEFLLEALGPDPQLRIPAQEIASAANRATSLTRQLLAFSRKQMLTPKVLDLNAIVTENFRMLDRVIGEDVELAVFPGADLGMVKADPGQIEQVIMNLAVNARDSMPHGGKLTIETSNVSLDETHARLHGVVEPGEYVVLCVRDTGIGMDSETQSHIFEPFFTTKGPKGTGLGLSTAYGIIKQSGGYIWVYSEPGKGTSFKVYLPRVTDTGEAVVVYPSIAAAKVQRGNETILLVEDEDNLRNMAKLYLESEGYTVLEAPDGAAAIQLANAHPGLIHLLLTDVIMPGMNGRELANHIFATAPGNESNVHLRVRRKCHRA